jgi:membrane protein
MKQKIEKSIIQSKWYNAFLGALKKIRIEKRDISAYDILIVFVRKVKKDEIVERANSVAFNFTLAIFPAIIFLFTLIPYIHYPPHLDMRIMKFLQDVMPYSLYEAAASTIEDIVSKPRGGLLSLGFILALYLATNGMSSLMRAFNKCYRTVDKRSFIKTKLIATVLTFTLAFELFFAIILLIVGQFFITMLDEYMQIKDYVVHLIVVLRFIVIFIVFLTGISCIYYLAPAVHNRWRFFSFGSFVATLLSLGVSYGFSLYINNFAMYNKLYGSIGALIAMMVWLSILSMVLLLGFEINASIDQATKEKADKMDKIKRRESPQPILASEVRG